MEIKEDQITVGEIKGEKVVELLKLITEENRTRINTTFLTNNLKCVQIEENLKKWLSDLYRG